MKLYLVLHGETEEMRRGVRLGHLAKLSRDGHKQAKIVAKRLFKIHFDKIFCSPTLRAKETARIIMSRKNKKTTKYTELPELVERKEPSKFIGTSTNKFPWDYFKKHRLNRNWRYDDGESFNDIFARVKKVLAIFAHESPNNIILAVSHSSITRAIFAYVMMRNKLTPRQYYDLTEKVGVFPTGITVLEYNQKIFESHPTWKLISWMDRSHLDIAK